jgi:hypothetical protein
MRRIYVWKRVEIIGGWRKLHNELNDFNFLPDIIRMMKSRKMTGGEE